MTDINVSAESAQSIDLEAWLGGATVAEASVDVYQRPDLLARIEEWQRRYERAEDFERQTGGERSAGEEDPLAALDAEGEALLADLAASRSTWYLRALSSADEQAINAAHPLPERPATFSEKPPVMQNRPTDAQARAFIKAYEAWQARGEQYRLEHEAESEAWAQSTTAALIARGAEKIARSVARIEVGGEVIATAVTLEQARSLPERIGEVQVGKILTAISAATELEPTMPAPFSRRGSETTQD